MRRKQRIRLSEATLHKIIRKCVNEAIRLQRNKLTEGINRKKRRRLFEGQNLVSDEELRKIAQWYDGMKNDFETFDGETFYVLADIDLDDPEDSSFYINDSSVGDCIDGHYANNPLEELVNLYYDFGYGGKQNVNSAMLEYLSLGQL